MLKMPVSELLPSWGTMRNLRFTEERLSLLFKKRMIHLDIPHLNTSTTLHQTVLRSMGMNSYGEAKSLAASLQNLGIRKVSVMPEVRLGEKIIDKVTLMYALEKYADQDQKLERMLIKAAGLRTYWIENFDLIIAQRIFDHQELEEDVKRYQQEAILGTARKQGLIIGYNDLQFLRRLLGL